MTVTADEELKAAFDEALQQDAGAPTAAAAPAMPAPPRKPEPGPDAAPPASTRRGRKPKADSDDKPRVAAPAATAAPAARDYSADLTDFGNQVWLGASMLRGGKILGIPVPDGRPFAAVWKDSLPNGVAAWNRAAQQNATVRQYVGKLGGEGGISWVLGVALWAAGLVGAAQALAQAPAEVRAQVIEANDQKLGEYVAEQVKALGLEVPDEQEAQAA